MIAQLPAGASIRVASAERRGNDLVLLAAHWGDLVEIRVPDGPPPAEFIDLRNRPFVMERLA